MMANYRQRNFIVAGILFFLTGLTHATSLTHAAEPSDWRQTAYSIAAGQIGAVNAYRIEDDLIWRRRQPVCGF